MHYNKSGRIQSLNASQAYTQKCNIFNVPFEFVFKEIQRNSDKFCSNS